MPIWAVSPKPCTRLNPCGVDNKEFAMTQGRRSFLAPTLGFATERPWRSPCSFGVRLDDFAAPHGFGMTISEDEVAPAIMPRHETTGVAAGLAQVRLRLSGGP